jgi:hypothetical protein
MTQPFRLLYVAPTRKPSEHPVVDELTLKMVAALRQGSKPSGYIVLGVVTCVCGAMASMMNVTLPNGWLTNDLSVHYLAYHRAQVPQWQLDAVRTLPAGLEPPTEAEMYAPRFRSEVADDLLMADVDNMEADFPDTDVVRLTYDLVVINHGRMAAHLTRAEVTLSIDGVWDAPEWLDLGATIAPDAQRSFHHVAVFRLAEFRRGRAPMLAASLSLSSTFMANWQLYGAWEDGRELRDRFVAGRGGLLRDREV